MRRQFVAQASEACRLGRCRFLTQPGDLAHQQIQLTLLADHHGVELLDLVFQEGELDFHVGEALLSVGLITVSKWGHARIGHQGGTRRDTRRDGSATILTMTAPAPAVVLLSGGLDSTTVLAIARDQGYAPYALSFRYGQRHVYELQAAQAVASALGAQRHVIAQIDLREFGGSALTADIEVPKGRDLHQMGQGIPVTYVPARNTVFLSFALAWAETLGAADIFIGVNALDYSGYPDCRPEYIAAFEAMARLATKAGVEGAQRLKIHAPLMHLNKAQIVREGLRLGVDYALTSSCYDPGPQGRPCGECDSCLLRAKGFAEAGVPDPLRLRHGMD